MRYLTVRQYLHQELIVQTCAIGATRHSPSKPGEAWQPMPDYAATAKKYEELAARATDPEFAEAYRNLAAGYQLLARGTELLNRRGESQDET
jgi:hypothetical protein